MVINKKSKYFQITNFETIVLLRRTNFLVLPFDLTSMNPLSWELVKEEYSSHCYQERYRMRFLRPSQALCLICNVTCKKKLNTSETSACHLKHLNLIYLTILQWNGIDYIR
jgi:hypothetical protein